MFLSICQRPCQTALCLLCAVIACADGSVAQERDITAFERQDKNEDGFLSGNEIGTFRALDLDRNGRVTRDEFLAPTSARGPAEPPVAASVLPRKSVTRPATPWDLQLRNQLETGSSWAILIGVDGYKQLPLECCAADARLLAKTLEQSCGFPTDQMVLMTDHEADAMLHPTRAQMESQVAALLKRVQPEDTVLVSFSGHGTLLNEQGFLCPLDFDGKRAGETGWRIDELRLMLQNCRAARKILILDSCHSGGALGTKPFGASGQQVGAVFEFAQGQITFSSCRANEQSQEDRQEGQGLFTMSLVRGLEGFADFDQNGMVDSDEIYRHVLSEVPARARELDLSNSQTPVRIIGQDVVGVFALSSVRPDLRSNVVRRSLRPGEAIRNSIGMKLVMLPTGVFLKGSPLTEYKRGHDEAPVGVLLTQRILMGAFEVTQQEYQTVMHDNPAFHASGAAGEKLLDGLPTGRFPVESVSWNDAVAFCERLNALPAERTAGRSYRLPTESEWEFACRANGLSAFHAGPVIDASHANIRAELPYWYATPMPSIARTRTVGSYPSNAFGLHDMHGNVAEWCQDYFAEQHSGSPLSVSVQPKVHEDFVHILELFSAEIQQDGVLRIAVDPHGPGTGRTRVVRGGSWNTDAGQARSAARRQQPHDYTNRTIGFRVVCQKQRHLIEPPSPVP